MRCAARLGIALILATLGALACEKTATLQSGALSAQPGILDYGAVDVGLTRELRVSVTNAANVAVGVPAIKIASDPNQELALADLLTTDCKDVARATSQTLGPGECARFSVRWSPLGAHAAQGTIEIDPADGGDAIRIPVEGTGLSTIFPALKACVLAADGSLDTSACTDLGAFPPAIPTVDFGNGVPGAAVSRVVRLFNEGEATLTFTAQPAIPGTSPTQFSESGTVPGAQLAPQASADVTVTAAPDALGTLQGALELDTDDPRQPQVELPLLIATTGISICVDPAIQLSWGLTLIGTRPQKTFNLSNCGMGDVSFDSFAMAPIPPTTTQFIVPPESAPQSGTVLHPNDLLSSAVVYAPTAVESDLGNLQLRFTNQYGAYTASVGLSGSGVTTFCGTSMEPTPTANIATSYAGNPNGPFVAFDPRATPSPVVPLDWIQLDASASTGASSYTWTLISQPAGSTTQISGAGATVTLQTLVSGDYVVQLAAADANGCTGTQSVTLHVVPSGDIHLELTWAESCGDVDLHYLGPDSELCGDYDTAYYNTNPDWGCATEDCGMEQDPGGIFPDGIRSDDAKLDHDDQWGNGPENVTQSNPFDSPAGAPYQIWVHYFSPVPDGGGGSGRCGTTHPTVDVYLGGALAASFTLTNGFTSHQVWHVADLAVSSQGKSIQVIPGDTSPGTSSACGGNSRATRPPSAKELWPGSHP